MMCNLRIDKKEFEALYGESFDLHFAKERARIEPELAEEDEFELRATPTGCLFVRLVAALFDQYLEQGQFSKAL